VKVINKVEMERFALQPKVGYAGRCGRHAIMSDNTDTRVTEK